MRARIKNVVTRLGHPGLDAIVGEGQTVIVPDKYFRLTRFDRECGAWECCGFVHVADLKTCPICGQSKEKAMTTSVKVHVNGQYRATVKQDGGAPVTVEGNYNGGSGEKTFHLPHPAKATFEITEEYVQDGDKRPAE